jgi:hypothetical protein
MGKVHSTIGASNFESTPQQRFVVENETLQGRQSPLPKGPQEINPAVAAGLRRQAQEQQAAVEHRNVQDARRRVELITGLGRRTKDVPVDTDNGQLVFTLRTLKSFEQNFLAQVVESAERIQMPNGNVGFKPTSMYNIKVEALSHSLYLIDGQNIDVVLGTANEEYEEQVIAKKDLIGEMDGALIDYLFVQYEKLSQETYDGYAPKTAEEAKEAVEAIRKSGKNT